MADTKQTDNVSVEMVEVHNEKKPAEVEVSDSIKGDIRYDPQARAKAANMTSFIAMGVNILLTVIKYLAGYFGNSSALIADAWHSLSDLASDIVVIVVSCIAKRPADVDHPYGHGRVELIGSVGVSIMLLAAGFIVGYESIEKLRDPGDGTLEWYTSVAALASIISKEALYWYTYLVGKKINSPVIIANAWHHRTDAMSSVVALVGTVITLLFGWPYADPIAGLFVAIMIVFIGVRILYQSVCSLVDRIPMEVVDKLNTMLATIPGVEGYSDVRAREMGAFLLVDLKLYVHPGTHVEDAEEIQNVVERRIKEEVKNVTEVMVRITSVRDEKNSTTIKNITTRIREAVMAVKSVKEITQIRVFGPEPYSVDLHIICEDFSSFCEQHAALHEVKRVVGEVAPMKAIHVGLECNDDHTIDCEHEGPCVVVQNPDSKQFFVCYK